MASQKTVQGWHPNQQLMQPPQQAPPPQGWMGSWPPGGGVAFPPGYPGPPPMQNGTAAHPRWNAGYWQHNADMHSQQQPWAPSVEWFPSHVNPHKRVPRPPSPSYWQTKLTNNGLGLEGMVRRKDPSEYDDEAPHTPWIWNPPSLLETGDRATPTQDFRLSQESLSAQARNQTSERRSFPRASYLYGAQDSFTTPTGPAGHNSDLSDLRPGQSANASSQRSIDWTDTWPNRARSYPPPASEVPPYPAPTPPIINARSTSAQQAAFTQEPKTFTSRGELHPTFSPSIIRTPTYYQQTRRSAGELPSTYHSPSPSSVDHSSTTFVSPLALHISNVTPRHTLTR